MRLSADNLLYHATAPFRSGSAENEPFDLDLGSIRRRASHAL